MQYYRYYSHHGYLSLDFGSAAQHITTSCVLTITTNGRKADSTSLWPLQHTGTLFYLTNTASHFTPGLSHKPGHSTDRYHVK